MMVPSAMADSKVAKLRRLLPSIRCIRAYGISGNIVPIEKQRRIFCRPSFSVIPPAGIMRDSGPGAYAKLNPLV